MIVVTHDMAEAFALGDRVGVHRRRRAHRLRHGPRRSRIDATRASGRFSTRCVQSPPDGRRDGAPLASGSRTAASSGRLLPAHRAAPGLDRRCHRGRRASRHSRRASAAAGPAASRCSPASRRRFRAWRCWGFCCRCRSSAASGRARRSSRSSLYALLPIVRTTVAGLRSIDAAVVEAGVAMGMTLAPAAVSGRAPAGPAVDHRRRPGRGGHWRRHGNGRRGDRRRRARRVHLPRSVDGRYHHHPGRRHPGRGARARRRRAARAGSSGGSRDAATAAASAAAGRRGAGRRRCAACLAVCARCARLGHAVVVGIEELHRAGRSSARSSRRPSKPKGVTVVRKLNLGGTFVCDRALRTGDLDVYVEYTGTAVSGGLPRRPVPRDSAGQALARARALYARRSA